MSIKFLYRQIFALFFLLSFSIIVLLNAFQGRNVLEDIGTVLLISFGYGLIGLVINFVMNLIFSDEKKFV